MNEKIHTIRTWLGTGSINFFGMPFAGKNTQVARLVKLLDATMIASGDIFRSQKDNIELQQIMATGANIPSGMFFDIMLPYFKNPELANTSLILSEVGRRDGEQETILNVTQKSGHPTKAVIYLLLDESAVWERFNASHLANDRGDRADDNSRAIVAVRLEKFQREIVPVIDFYRHKNLLIEVDGTASPDSVTETVIDVLYRRATAR